MTPLFISFRGTMKGREARGWVVLHDREPIRTGADMERLHRDLELARGYDTGSIGIINFQRLES